MAKRQLNRPKIGNKAKSRRSVHKRAYYQAYRQRYELKKIRRKAKRAARIAAAKLRRSVLT